MAAPAWITRSAPRDRSIYGLRVAELPEAVLDPLDRLVGDTPGQGAHASCPRRAGAATTADPTRPVAPVTRKSVVGETVNRSSLRLVIGLGLFGDLLDPAHDLGRLVDGDGRRLAGLEPAVEVGHEVAQALECLHLLAHELPGADGNLDERPQRVRDTR